MARVPWVPDGSSTVRPCLVCRQGGGPLCSGCGGALDPPPELAAPPGVDELGAVLAYRGTGAELVTAWKAGNERGLTGRFATAMAAAAPGRVHDVVTWAPSGSTRRHRRGFDTAELLARAVGVRLGVPSRRLLVRRPGPSQTGRSASARAAVSGFDPAGSAPSRVLVVDDVCTTGATLASAAVALRSAGASWVDAVVLARTPEPG